MKSRPIALTTAAVLLAVVCGASRASIKVSVVKSWGDVPVFQELTDNWSAYGSTQLTIDTSLLSASDFTYQDLVDTDADVIWLSDPAGGTRRYSAGEIAAVMDYAAAGHSILGTYATLQYSDCDNRGLADVFGLRSDILYNINEVLASQSFDILVDHPLFNGIPDPYVTSGYYNAEVPADDERWDADDLGSAQLLARTEDWRGIITWYETDAYHAIYVSKMVEYNGSALDTQFLYNALTIPEPAAILLLGVGGLALLRKRRTMATLSR